METLTTHTTRNDQIRDTAAIAVPPNQSAVAWGAIFGGAVAAAALSLILLLLGTGLGLSSVSPWSNDGISATTFGITTIIWITFTSLVASAVGGYIAGRLRTRWLSTHSDEVYFRDTAHGFLAWAVATLLTASLLTSAITAIVSGGVKAGTTIAGHAVAGGAAAATATMGDDISNSMDDKSIPYFMDSLFRRDVTAVDPNPQTDMTAAKAEIAGIFFNAMRNKTLPPTDARYAGQLIARHTGLSEPEAEKRVTDTYNQVQAKLNEAEVAAKKAADDARKTSAYGSLWLFISLLIGAFIASLSAIYGGRQRDYY